MKALEINDVVEAIEKRPEDWWNAVGFKDHEEAMRYFADLEERVIEEGEELAIFFNQVNNFDGQIIFDWLVKHGDIDEDEAVKNILNGCYWFDAVKYLKRGLMNI